VEPEPTVIPEPTPPPVKNEGVPDAVPRAEPRSRLGNPPFYEVFGKRYYVLSSSVGYVERGVASWYGPGFHQVRTSIGETYDMYGMTAAHKTLPLPAYVRVTNLQNGRSVVVRVNDRGPFVGNRIIDLSYSAAARLDMLKNGTALVEVRAVEPEPSTLAAAPPASSQAPAATPPQASPTTIVTLPAEASQPAPVTANNNQVTSPGVGAPLYIQAGAFSNPDNAQRLQEKLAGGGYGKIFVREDQIGGRHLYRVRIGPVPSVTDFDRIVAALEKAGIHDAHLALD
jgi:rare lipoprotein A